MELNKRTITVVINALKIARDTSQIAFSKNLLNTRIPGACPNPVILENQAILIDSLEEYEKLINDFQELLTRQNSQSES